MDRKAVCGIILTLLLTGMLTLAFNIQPVEAEFVTITIKGDGSIDPPDAPISTVDNITYIFTGDVISDGTGEGLTVARDNIVIDGAGYTLQGCGWPQKGIIFSGNNVTVKNLNIKGWLFGFAVSGTSLIICGNNITDISRDGIAISGSNNTIYGNNIEGAPGDSYGIQHWGDSNSIDYGNTISRFWYGICITYSASNHSIYKNTITDNTCGIGTREPGASHNKIYENEILNNPTGISLGSSDYNNVTKNHITSSRYKAIHIRESSNNVIFGNDIVSNQGTGIYLQSASYTSMIANNIINNSLGIRQDSASNNTIYHNNFINNTHQVYDLQWDYPSVTPSINVWDDGYPSGGNYWSDYNGTDFYSGPYQNEPGSDGIGDTPYVIDVNNRDNYPLMAPWESPIDWWPMFQHDPQHTGRTMEDGPATNTTLWTFQTGAEVVSSPAVVDGRVFVGSWDWGFYCLDYVCGVELWRVNIGGWPYSSSPVVVDGVVYTGSTREYSSKVFAINATIGSIIWIRNFNFQQRSNMNFYKGILYVGSQGGFFALNATTGSIIWSSPEQIHLWGAPAISNGILYISHRFNLTARNATTGSLLWTKEIGYAFYTNEESPTVAYGMIFVGVGGKTLALNATNGEIIWSSILGSEESAPAVSEGKLFTTRRGSPGIFALNTTTGEVIWNSTSCSDVASSPAVAHGKVYVGTLDAKIYALNETNGEICWVYEAGDRFWGSSPAIVDGKLYIGSLDGEIYAIGERYVPTANFAWTPLSPRIGEVVTFDASISTPNGGIIEKYEWNFGDGENATGEVVTHSYLIAGNYTVTLNVTDCEGLWDIEQKTIEVKPLPSFSLTIEVSAGGTTDPAPGTYICTANSSVEVTAIPDAGYLFDYWKLDGVNVSSANPYLVLMDKNHTLKDVFAAVPPPLFASISPLSASILVGQSVTFTSTVSGGYTPYSYQWYLDGNPVSGATTSTWAFTPTTSGIYYVYLKVTDDNNNVAQSETARITVSTVPVGGHSVPIRLSTTAKPATIHIALLTILTAIFITIKRKKKRKTPP